MVPPARHERPQQGTGLDPAFGIDQPAKQVPGESAHLKSRHASRIVRRDDTRRLWTRHVEAEPIEVVQLIGIEELQRLATRGRLAVREVGSDSQARRVQAYDLLGQV